MMLSSGIFASALRKPLFDRPFTAPKGMCGFRLERSAYSGSNIIRLREDAGRFPDTMNQRFGAWSQLITLFRLIYEGGQIGRAHV